MQSDLRWFRSFRQYGFVFLFFILMPASLSSMGQFTIHAQKSSTPVFGQAVIARDYTLAGYKTIDPLSAFPSGLSYLVAVTPVQNPVPNGEVLIQWYKDGQPYLNSYSLVMNDYTFAIATYLKGDAPLNAGKYEIHLSYQNQIVSQASATLADGSFIYPPHFGDDCGAFSAELQNPRSAFPAGVYSIGFTAQTAHIPKGSVIDIDWLLNDQPLAHVTWTMAQDNQTLCSTYNLKAGLATGTYTVRLSANGRLLQTGQAEIKP